MIIRKINITEFGALRNFSMEFGSGVNVIRGANETGKSTILSFIRFAFYGLPSSRGAANLDERERAFGRAGGTAAGFIEISDGAGEWRIRRKSLQSGGSVCEVTNLLTGLVCREISNPGEYFLGVGEAVFDSVCSVKQLGVGTLSGTEINTAIDNMLTAADETLNTQRALKKLEAAKKELRQQRGDKGRIPEIKREREALHDKLIKAEKASEDIISYETLAEKYRRNAADRKKERDECDDRLRAYESCEALRAFDGLHAAEAEYDAARSREERYIAEKGRDGKIPDKDYIKKLDGLRRRLEDGEKQLAVSRARLAEVKASAAGDPLLAARSADIEAAGGREAVAGSFENRAGRAGLFKTLGIIMLSVGVLLAASSLILFFAVSDLPGWFTSGVSMAITIAGFILAVAGAAMLPVSNKTAKEALAWLEGFGFVCRVPLNETADRFRHYADDCEASAKTLKRWQSAQASAETENSGVEASLEAIRKECREALELFGRSEEEDAALGNALVDAANDWSAVADAYTELHKLSEERKKSLEAVKKSLEGQNEAEIRAHLAPGTAELLAGTDPAQLRRKKDEATEWLEIIAQKQAEAGSRLAVLRATTENPARMASELEETEEKLLKAEERFNAIDLALSAIQEAGEAVKKNITPRIRQRAGELMSLLSDGKYTDFGIDKDFGITLTSGTGSFRVALLSGGTKDAAYFSLRIALLEMIFRQSPPPLMADEICAQLDDTRTAGMMNILSVLAENGLQSIILTCHGREAEILEKSGAAFVCKDL